MIKKPILALTAALAALVVGTPSSAFAITGGHPSATAYPFMGTLQRLDSPLPDFHVCGVELLAPRWALTAAHCTRTSADVIGRPTTGRPIDWTVRFDSTQVGSGGQLVKVDRFTQLNNRYFVNDLALLHLSRPVHLTPLGLARDTPPAGTPVRILGWGETCADSRSPRCTPHRLREADTVVQPSHTCDPGAGNVCIGSRDGSVSPQDFDSGGPAVVSEGGTWRLLGTVEGGGVDEPAIFTDVVGHRSWIDSYVLGHRRFPTDTRFPSDTLDATVSIGGCAGSIIDGADSRPSDPALMLTAGHCVTPRPPRGRAVISRRYAQYVYVGNRHGVTIDRAETTRTLYATMTGADVAVIRLDQTYGALRRIGVRPYELASTGPQVGEDLQVRSGYSGETYHCQVQGIVPGLLEGGYRTTNVIRYRLSRQCSSGFYGGPSHGDSGSPLVDPSTGQIVGMHVTSNDDGKHCIPDNPCEVSATGAITSVKGAKYGTQTAEIIPCLGPGSLLTLSRPGCLLTAQGATAAVTSLPAVVASDGGASLRWAAGAGHWWPGG